MSARVCRPKLFKNLCLNLVSGVPHFFFRTTALEKCLIQETWDRAATAGACAGRRVSSADVPQPPTSHGVRTLPPSLTADDKVSLHLHDDADQQTSDEHYDDNDDDDDRFGQRWTLSVIIRISERGEYRHHGSGGESRQRELETGPFVLQCI